MNIRQSSKIKTKNTQEKGGADFDAEKVRIDAPEILPPPPQSPTFSGTALPAASMKLNQSDETSP